MKLYWLRSFLFALLFYPLTILSCVLLLPTLILPRRVFLFVVFGFVHTTTLLERYVLGLDYEIRGLEHLPKTGSYLVAAKHQSAYETTKLHILFGDPAIVLKRELLRIPIWGWYLAKSDVIAIDRSSPKSAMRSVQEGALRMACQGRPIIIFPQGTRVFTDTPVSERPYKIGIIRMQEATQLPIIPMALNSGYFWPRNSFIKKSGRVIFEFLPPIFPRGKDTEKLSHIQCLIEDRSNILLNEAQAAELVKTSKSKISFSILIWAALFGFLFLWSINWLLAAHYVQKAIHEYVINARSMPHLKGSKIEEPALSGFPFKMKLTSSKQSLFIDQTKIMISEIEAKVWPIIGMPIMIKTGPILIQKPEWKSALNYDDFLGRFHFWAPHLFIEAARLRKDKFESILTGKIVLQSPYPALDLTLNVREHEGLLLELAEKNALTAQQFMIAGAALGALKRNGEVLVKLHSQNQNVYLGPLKVYSFEDMNVSAQTLEDGTSSHFATQRKKPDLGR